MLIAYGFVLIAVGMDLRSMRISNRLILIGWVVSLVRRILCDGLGGLFTGLFLISLPVILLYLLFLAGALGAGDIKLFSLVGGFTNFKELTECMFFAFLLAGIYSLCKMLYHGTFFSSIQNVGIYWQNLCLGYKSSYCPAYGKKSKIHFSIFIFLGIILSQVV